MGETVDCIVKIRSLYPSMSIVEKKVADYILLHPDEVVFMTVAQLASKIGTAESSIIRFCHNIGLQGFSSLKINLAQNQEKNKKYMLDEISVDNDYDSNLGITTKVFSSVIRSLNETLELVSEDILTQTVDVLCNADKIVFFGIGTSAIIASDTYYRFMRIGLPASAATDPHIMLLSASMLDENSVAFGISHTGRTTETIRAIDIARKQGAHTICLTSYQKSPITQISDISIVTSASENKMMREAITSRIAHITIMDSLYACISLKKYDTVKPKIDTMHELLEKVRMK